MNANDLFNAVMQLDLEPIKTKLMHVESGEGWSLDQANAVEKEYRRFLCLMKMYPDEAIAPLVDVDTFWHYHILDTMKYAADCEQAFGYFVHHYPYVGLRGDDDAQFRIDSGERMQGLYEATFGEAYPVAGATPVEQPDALAYCAGPWDKRDARGADPIRISAAYCAGPWDKQGASAGGRTATAYCAGPWDQRDARAAGRTDTAYCAGPWDKPHAHGAAVAATAYCAGPWDKQNTRGVAKAATAYCAGPWDKRDTRGVAKAATAYCAGPWDKRDTRAAAKAATAYCAGPWAPAGAPAALNV
ncbi:hypothetical protein [Massilia sp. Root335]|uniref:glycine-rich domain-containing protein n=1 Tax=Massilia sp. Root335 TaxID=1736517 RepID=UPI000AC45D38|nr:hypothetical protein [Massilia sp. Root335]